MAYRNVGRPRFYVNILEWLSLIDNFSLPHKQLLTLPVNPIFRADIDFTLKGMTDNGFIAILGHTYGEIEDEFYQLKDINGNQITLNTVINGDTPKYNGFSISTFTGSNDINKFKTGFNDPEQLLYIGSIIIGSYYDLPYSPDLSLNLKWEYGGSYHETTYLGGSISNTMWSEPPMWGDQAPWELTDPSNINYAVPIYHYKSGRRVWELKFSYLDGEDLWGSNRNISDILINSEGLSDGDITTSETNEDTFTYNLLTDDNFFSQVWNKTLGGTIPFIFQPDGDGDIIGSGNSNPDQFAICRIKGDSLTAEQVAPGVYDISLTIEETW